jgi:hypothetical protein
MDEDRIEFLARYTIESMELSDIMSYAREQLENFYKESKDGLECASEDWKSMELEEEFENYLGRELL